MAAGRLALFLSAVAIGVPAGAQTPRAASASHGGDRPDRVERREDWRAKMQAHERQEAADVALLLRLKPDQQAAYQAWTASLRPPEGERRGDWKHDDGEGTPQTLPQELDRMQARMAERDQRMRAHLEATRRFYAALSPEQQTLFDALMRLRHGGGRHGGLHGRRGPGMRGGEGDPRPPPGA